MHVRNIALITTILLCGPAIAQAPAPTAPSAVYTDPPPDLAYPASTLAIEIKSHGSVMNGLVYRPGGAGPFPLVVLMHGLPGNEQNLDLAQALRRAGWAVMTFHYRGSWGSEGQFSLENVIEDARVAVEHSADPAVAKAWNIDPARIVVIGHSMGGLAAALSASSAPKRLATVLLAPWDPSTLATLLRPLAPSQRNAQAMDRWGNVTGGRLRGISSQQIAAQIFDHGERWRLSDAAHGLSKQPLLIVTAKRDLPSSHAGPLMTALRAGGAKFSAVEIAGDHVFDDRRIELETAVINWLSLLAVASVPNQPMPGPALPAVIDHVGLQVADPVVSAEFYQRILALRPVPQRVAATMRWLGSGDFQLHLIPGRTKPVDGATDTHFAFRVASLANELEILDRNHVAWSDSDGAVHKVTTRADGVLQAYFQDPDGYWIEVNQAPK